MHIRRLVKAGQSSYTVSLPKQWLEKQNLKKGDTIFIKEIEDELIIYLKEKTNKKQSRELTLTIDNDSIDTLKRQLTSAYINNYNPINIIGKTLPKHAGEIRSAIHDFVALEISEQTSSKIVAKDLLNIEEISIDKTIRRMDMIIRSMLEDSYNILNGKNVYDSIHFRDQDINRLYFLLFKLIKESLRDKKVAQKFNLHGTKTLSTWYLILNLENIADCQKSICKLFETNKKDDLKKLFKRIEDLYINGMNAYFKDDKKLADQIAKSRIHIFDSCNNYFEKNKSFHSMEIITLLKEMTTIVCNISRITLDQDE